MAGYRVPFRASARAATVAAACLYGVLFYGCLPTYTFGESAGADASGDAGAETEASTGPDGSRDATTDAASDAPVDSSAADSGTDASSDATTDAPVDAPFDSPIPSDSAGPTAVVGAGSKQYSTGYGYQTHLVYAQNDGRYWFFYLDDTAGAIETLASPDLLHWTAEAPIPLTSGYSLTDGNNFSVAYANLASTDVVHIVVDATSSSDTAAFHIRAFIAGGAISAATPVELPDSESAGGGCPQDGPVTLVAPNGYVYDVTAWTSHSGTACDTNIYLSPAPDTGTSWSTGAFSHDGYFISEPTFAFSHDLVSLPDAGTVLAVWPDEDNTNEYLFDSFGWAFGTAFDAGEGAPGTTGTVPDAAAELFNGTGATSSYDDWSMCRLSDANIHVVRHLTSATNLVSGFEEVVYDGTAWQVSANTPASVSSPWNTGVVLLADGNLAHGLLAVTVGTDNTLNIAKSVVTGTWTTVGTIPGTVQRQSLGGSGCGSGPAVLFWTEGVAGGGPLDGGPEYVVMRADLSSFLEP